MTIIAVKEFQDLSALKIALEKEEKYVVPRPSACPRGCDSVMWGHPGYERGVIDEKGELQMISIQRFRCNRCGQTVSCLFDFIVPYRRFPVQTLAQYAEEYLSLKRTYEELAWSGDDVGPSKSSIWRWVQQVARGARKLARTVQQEAVMSDLANAEVEPVVVTCPNSYKAHTENKAVGLNDGSTSLALTERFLVRRLFEKDKILTVLHRYFVTTAETVWSIFTARKGVLMSTQQSTAYAIF